ncbi:hypothetical protein [Agromyces badenianii]|uniref:hypothetical protein n=1 Tax=Agromyces badenianii TaxID=2080742 RepID=UPI000D5933F4|nr:hypothetical protein [Agromyces badenianii]PWC04257.1 hypothetical protein DCE94_08875 [Agromyces badenianii]
MSTAANENAPAVSSNSGEGNDRTRIEGTTLTTNSTTEPLFDARSLDVLASQLGDLAAAHAADAVRPEPEPQPGEPLLIPEAALESGVGAIDLRRAIATGELRSHRTESNCLVVFRATLLEWARTSFRSTAPEAS